jgi:hypothetical protein
MLGASVLDALVYVHPNLRRQGEFWKDFPENDAYVCPTDQYLEELENEPKKEKLYVDHPNRF